jgi:thiosulfate/3-mercaptopyruvate sulfurtransferase
MSAVPLPLFLEPEALQQVLGKDELLVVDLSSDYEQGHIPGAVHLDYEQITRSQPPVKGLLPDRAHLEALCRGLGLRTDTRVVACDDEGGGRASRLLWTLEVAGHAHCSLLDGGLTAWREEHYPITTQAAITEPRSYPVHFNDAIIADRDYVLAHLHDPGTVIIDCRKPSEYSGEYVMALRGGHIPGAVNIDWRQSQDPQRHLRLRPAAELRALYEASGATPDKEIIVYCHSHRRSAHTYLVLKSLGYPRVRGYPGSWSEWGNDPGLPVEA